MNTPIKFPITSLESLKKIAKRVKKVEHHPKISDAQKALAEYLKFNDWHHISKTILGGAIITAPGTIERPNIPIAVVESGTYGKTNYEGGQAIRSTITSFNFSQLLASLEAGS